MPKSNKIYLDYAASAEANPSSLHRAGVNAKRKLEDSRKIVARVLNAKQGEIIFTSGDTESNNLAIQGTILAWHKNNKKKGKRKNLPHIITTNIEHPSVIETCKLLEERGLARLTLVGVESSGRVDPEKIKKVIKKDTVLISVMYANNEIGAIQPIAEIAKEIKYFRKISQTIFPIFHTDAVQAVNYLDLNVEKLGIDLMSLSGAKIEGSGQVGVLYKKKSAPLVNIFGGGDQEMGIRPGTENLSEIIKFSVALNKAQQVREKEAQRLTKLRDYFFGELSKIPFDIKFNGDLQNRLPNNVNITFSKIPSDLMVIELSEKNIMASSKSACKSSEAEGSYVIKALYPKANSEVGGVRFSLSKNTTKSDIEHTVNILAHIIKKLGKWYN